MARLPGLPAYPGKSVNGSTYLTTTTSRDLKRAAKRLGRSESDIVEHALRVVVPTLEKTSPLVGRKGVFGKTAMEIVDESL